MLKIVFAISCIYNAIFRGLQGCDRVVFTLGIYNYLFKMDKGNL
jgi:hypothetical protein